jgi:hypothetical protein
MKNHKRSKPPVQKKKGKPLFFGWTNVKWFIREFGNTYSSQPSYFSKKRIESGISFVIGQTGMILFLIFKYADLTMTDFIMWASLEFAVGGYITYQIQKQKRHESEFGYYDESSGDYDNEKPRDERYEDYGKEEEHHDRQEQDEEHRSGNANERSDSYESTRNPV